jgi:hypothetical protein
MRASESKTHNQLLEEERKSEAVIEALSPESGPNLGKGIGDFPPWYGTDASP